MKLRKKQIRLTKEERENALKKKYSGIVYHYCSLDTFLKIITNHTIRASNIRKSNDYHEIVSCVGSFKAAVRRACIKYMNDNPWNKVFKSFYNPEGLGEIDIDGIIGTAIENESCTYYCACFSKERDLLSQWITYADDGRGVAIAFSEAILYAPTDYCHYKYSEIEYNLNNPRSNRLQRLSEYILENLKSVDETHGDEVTEEDYANAFFRVVNPMVYNSVFYKDTSFKAEKERRLVFYPFGNVRNLRYKNVTGTYDKDQMYYDKMLELVKGGEKMGEFYRKPISFGIKDSKISSYVDFDFSSCTRYFVPEIILGPKCTIDDLDLKLLLVSNGFDLTHTKISHSSSSYR